MPLRLSPLAFCLAFSLHLLVAACSPFASGGNDLGTVLDCLRERGLGVVAAHRGLGGPSTGSIPA